MKRGANSAWISMLVFVIHSTAIAGALCLPWATGYTTHTNAIDLLFFYVFWSIG